jgi:hypothetical protein
VKSRKSWQEKLDNPKLPKVVAIPLRMQKQYGKGTMVIPNPREVDSLIRTVRKGSLITMSQIRQELSHRHMADVACPLVTGIALRLSAEAAEEDAAAGKKRITPYWRVIGDDGSLYPRLPGGVKRQSERLRDEGHSIAVGVGKRRPRVVL